VVTTLYRKDIREADLQQLTQRRRTASEFIQTLCLYGHRSALDETSALFTKPEDAQLASLRNTFDETRFFFQFGTARVELFGTPRNLVYKTIVQQIREVEMMRSVLDFTKRAEPAKAIKALLAALEFEAYRYDPKLARDEFYFGGTPKTEDLLDFLVWQHQADQLGIVLDEQA